MVMMNHTPPDGTRGRRAHEHPDGTLWCYCTKCNALGVLRNGSIRGKATTSFCTGLGSRVPQKQAAE